MTSVGARGGDAPDTVGTMQAVPTAPDLADSGAATAPSSLLDRTRDVWLPIVLYLAIRGIGLAVLARFAQLRNQNLADLLTAWDGKWMIGLATYGYNDMPWRFVDARGEHTADTAYAFFPGFPMLVRAVAQLPGFDAYRAALTVNVILGCAAAVAAYRLGRLCVEHMPQVPTHLAERAGLLTTVLFAAAPMSIVLTMAYTEALYCALAGWALVGVMERKWILAGICTALAGFCRPTSVVLIGVVALAALLAVLSSDCAERVKAALCVLLAPLGWVTYLLVVAHHTGSLTGWFRIQTEGWGTTFDLGVQTWQFVNYTLINGSDIADLSVVALLAASIVLIVLAVRSKMPWPITLYGALVVISLLGSGGLMMSRPRLLLPAFVLLIPIAIALAKTATRAQAWTCVGVVTVTCWYGAHMVSVYPHAM
ncbi:Predicted integral membrane protein (plasmid) [Tsukamurella tyrosinosolvens]|uniref:Mannosyltransferase (PIG-V) n=2 Tax=Tsukamurella tyrosinosolvens TaxID=57704 RepID=A0A1H5C1L8_TSUTY|nr:Mannosyltransferase (PIG-V) [Tsukamurella tyrosinosolvens]VEI01793.1 Predicted integral membrane protein [Tsukamurella tyrosinosolvens]